MLGYPSPEHMVWEERQTLPTMMECHTTSPPPSNVACARMCFDLYTVCIPVTALCRYLLGSHYCGCFGTLHTEERRRGSLRSLSRLRFFMGRGRKQGVCVHFEIRQEQIHLFYRRAQSGWCLLILRLLSTSQCGRNMCFSAQKCVSEQRGILHTRLYLTKDTWPVHSVEVGFLCRNDLLELAIAKVNYNMHFLSFWTKIFVTLSVTLCRIPGQGCLSEYKWTFCRVWKEVFWTQLMHNSSVAGCTRFNKG